MTEQLVEIDRFLEAVELRVEAFGVCEIGQSDALRCAPSDSIIVHFVLAGAGFLECEYGRYPLLEGTAVVVPKSMPKRLAGLGPVKKVKEGSASCTVDGDLMRFRASNGAPGLVLGCAQLSSAARAELPLFDKMTQPLIQRSQDPLLHSLFQTMLDELQKPRLGTRAFVSALMKQVLIVLLRSRTDDETSTLLMTNARLAGAVAAILDHPEHDHTVDSLAGLVGMSRSSFSQHFNSAYDLSPKAFVQAARLSSAARMLKGSDLPVKSVAASVGYASRSHFSRAFHAKFGVDPTAFRKSYLSSLQ